MFTGPIGFKLDAPRSRETLQAKLLVKLLLSSLQDADNATHHQLQLSRMEPHSGNDDGIVFIEIQQKFHQEPECVPFMGASRTRSLWPDASS